jgi:hypothetical protein
MARRRAHDAQGATADDEPVDEEQQEAGMAGIRRACMHTYITRTRARSRRSFFSRADRGGARAVIEGFRRKQERTEWAFSLLLAGASMPLSMFFFFHAFRFRQARARASARPARARAERVSAFLVLDG